jgi:excisionase family DNA binding protein
MRVAVRDDHEELELLTTGEVARMFRVDPKTVSRWAKEGKFTEYRTPGNHWRFDAAECLAMLHAGRPVAPGPAE